MLIEVIQLIVIAILAILCLTAVLKMYCLNNFGNVVLKTTGGGGEVEVRHPKLREKLNKFKELWIKVKIIKKPIEYFAKGDSVNADEHNKQFTDKVFNILTNIAGMSMPRESIITFASALGASTVPTFMAACSKIIKQKDSILVDFQTFTAEFIPAIAKNITDKSKIKTLAQNNFDDVKFIIQTILDKGWITNSTIISGLQELVQLDSSIFSDSFSNFIINKVTEMYATA